MLKRWTNAMTQDCGLLLIRVIIGVIFVFHGGQKLFGIWGGSGLAAFASYLEQLQVPVPAIAAVMRSGNVWSANSLSWSWFKSFSPTNNLSQRTSSTMMFVINLSNGPS